MGEGLGLRFQSLRITGNVFRVEVGFRVPEGSLWVRV